MGRSFLRLTGAAALAALLGVAGCEPQRAEQLTEDVSTEADVRRLFGEPRTVEIGADGTRTMHYPRQPEGYANYVMVIGADGKLASLRQLLNADNFARVQPGMARADVLRILGPFARERRFDLKNETLVEWRYRDGQEARLFGVTFGADGKVVSTASAADLRETDAAR